MNYFNQFIILTQLN